jgi:hypothetical protein
MTKISLFNIVNDLKAYVKIQNIKYRKVFHVKVCMCCAIYKLAHGANFLTWVNFLKLENQLLSLVLNEFVYLQWFN